MATAPFRSLEAPRQAGGEKAPYVHNKPVIGISLPASVREDNHDIPPCTLDPLLLSEEIWMLRFILLGHGLETWSWTLEDVGHKAGIPRIIDRDPFCELDGGMELR
ncbi:hypothetical protein V8E54_007166 [Elaphomyces granulatus]